MGRADDKEGEALLSEADDEKDKDYSDKDTTDIDDVEAEPKKKYKCTEPGCTARFLRPSRLTWHLRKHNDERPYKCSIEGCTRAYTNSSHLKRHENTHKPVTTFYTCEQCGLKVGSLFSLKRHHKMIHDPKRLTCAECGTKFRKKHCYNEHLSMHAGISMYKCQTCQHEFPTLRLMKKHQLVHDPKKTYACKSTGCTQVFNKWSKLCKHVETDHEFDLACDKCDKKFKLKCQLARHSLVHIEKNSFLPCPYENCPKFYTHKRNLDEHEETFHRGKRYHCDTCNAGLTSKASLIRHIKASHEFPKQSQKQSRKTRRPRKDIGIPKNSMAIKLAGLNVPHKIQKKILERQPMIVLERFGEDLASSKNIEDENESSMKSLEKEEHEENLEKVLPKKPKVGFDRVTQTFVSLEDENEIKSVALMDETLNNEETNFDKSVCAPEQTEEEILFAAGSLLESGQLIVLENNEEFSDIEQRNEDLLLLAERLLHNSEDMVSELLLEENSNVPHDIQVDTSLPASDTMEKMELNIMEKRFQRFSNQTESTENVDILDELLEKPPDDIQEINVES